MTLGVQYTWFKITGRLVGTGGLLKNLKQWGKKTKKGSQVGVAYDPPTPPPSPIHKAMLKGLSIATKSLKQAHRNVFESGGALVDY